MTRTFHSLLRITPGAGGNMAGSTISPGKAFSDLDPEAFRNMLILNLIGTVLPTLVLAEQMISAGRETIINFSPSRRG